MIRFHEDAAIFREAVSITQVRTGLAAAGLFLTTGARLHPPSR
jgi:hypothetical protein